MSRTVHYVNNILEKAISSCERNECNHSDSVATTKIADTSLVVLPTNKESGQCLHRLPGSGTVKPGVHDCAGVLSEGEGNWCVIPALPGSCRWRLIKAGIQTTIRQADTVLDCLDQFVEPDMDKIPTMVGISWDMVKRKGRPESIHHITFGLCYQPVRVWADSLVHTVLVSQQQYLQLMSVSEELKL